MSPALVAQLVIAGLQLLAKEAPSFITSIRAIMNKEDPTPADWAALKAELEADTYEKLVPASRLPKDPPSEQPVSNAT